MVLYLLVDLGVCRHNLFVLQIILVAGHHERSLEVGRSHRSRQFNLLLAPILYAHSGYDVIFFTSHGLLGMTANVSLVGPSIVSAGHISMRPRFVGLEAPLPLKLECCCPRLGNRFHMPILSNRDANVDPCRHLTVVTPRTIPS